MFLAVGAGELGVAQPAYQADLVALAQALETINILTFPGIDIVPLCLDDGGAGLVVVRQAGGHREARHLLLSDHLELHCPHEAAQFDFVDLFHNLWFICPMQRNRIVRPGPKNHRKQFPF